MRMTTRRAAVRIALSVGLVALAPPASAGDGTAGTLEGINGQMEVETGALKEDQAAGAAFKGRVDGGVAQVGTVLGAASAWKDFTEAYDALAPGDGRCDPDYSPAGSPEVPSACAGSEACNECYEKAVRDIDFYRFSLDKGRCLASSTIDFAKKAMAFGDSASGSFGVGGMAWSLKARPEIEKAVAKLRKTYQGKYGEWVSGLERSLRALGRCEEEHFGERDWYGRFGYVYYSFMADRYRSPD